MRETVKRTMLIAASITLLAGCGSTEKNEDIHADPETDIPAQNEIVDIQQTDLIENDELAVQDDPEPLYWGGKLERYGDVIAAAPAEEDAWQVFEDETNESHVSFVDVSSDEWTSGDYWEAPMAKFSINREYTSMWDLMDTVRMSANENGIHYQIEEMDLGQYHFLFFNPEEGDIQMMADMHDEGVLVINPSRNLDLEDEGFLNIIASVLR